MGHEISDGFIIFSVIVGILMLMTFFGLIAYRKFHHINELLEMMKAPGQILLAKCMFKEGVHQDMGVVQILHDNLILRTSGGREYHYQVSSLTLMKETKDYSKGEWWGKTVFVIKTMDEKKFAFGVTSPAEWEAYFNKNMKSEQQGK